MNKEAQPTGYRKLIYPMVIFTAVWVTIFFLIYGGTQYTNRNQDIQQIGQYDQELATLGSRHQALTLSMDSAISQALAAQKRAEQLHLELKACEYGK